MVSWYPGAVPVACGLVTASVAPFVPTDLAACGNSRKHIVWMCCWKDAADS